MSQTGYTPISLYYSATASAAPIAGNLVAGELAINTADGKLFYKDSGGVVQTLATKGSAVVGGSDTQVQYNSSGSLAGSANLTFNGTSLTLGGNPTLSAGTANGVAYLNGSKVLTTGSALTFDGAEVFKNSGGTVQYNDVRGNAAAGTRLSAGGTLGTDSFDLFQNSSYGAVWNRANTPIAFGVNNAEQMRLTSTGLGIGTSSPSAKLHVVGDNNNAYFASSTGTAASYARWSNTGGSAYIGLDNSTGSALGKAYSLHIQSPTDIAFHVNGSGSIAALFDTSGNLGLGVTPSAWGSLFKATQVGISAALVGRTAANVMYLNNNIYVNSSNADTYLNTGYATQYIQNSSGQHLWNITASGTAGNPITFTQAMTLDASGNLGVGTTSPASYAKFAARGYVTTGSVNYSGLFSDAVNSSLYIGHTATTVNLLSDTAITFATGGSPASFTERARIDSSGNLLVATTNTNPAGNNTAGFAFQNGGLMSISRDGNPCAFLNRSSSDGEVLRWYRQGSQVGNVSVSTVLTTYNTTSDYRLKTVVGPVLDAGQRIDALEPIEYTWKINGSKTRGFLAHKFQEVYADSVSGVKDAVDEEGAPIYQTMQAGTSEVIADLVAEIQSLRKRLLALESK